jgi:hypothetical protein
MRKTTISLLVIGLLLSVVCSGIARAESARAAKRFAVVSLASYDELPRSLELAGKLTGKSKLARGFLGTIAVFTQGRGLEGLDASRPWALVFESDGSEPRGYVCLPVDDPDTLIDVFRPLAQKIEDLGDGVQKVQGKRPANVSYVKRSGGWLFVSQKLEALENTPDDPTDLLAGLTERYGMAVRLYLRDLPEGEREKMLAAIRKETSKQLDQRPGEPDRLYAIRKRVAAEALAVVRTLAEELDTLTIGWTLDRDTQAARLELAFTARQGSEASYALAQLAEAQTRFAAFRLPDALVTGHVAADYPGDAIGGLDELFEAIRENAFAEIDAKEPSDSRAEAGKEAVGGLLEVLQKSAASGRLDGAMSLVAHPEGATLVSGRHIADGETLDATFRRFMAAVREHYPLQSAEAIELDAAEVHGVQLHTISAPVPREAENREQIVELFGERVDYVVGIGPESFYLAAGRDAMGQLREAIERSAASGPTRVPPMELSIALADLVKHAVANGEGEAAEQAAKAAAALGESPGKDHVRLRAAPVEDGLSFQVEIEQGVLEMIGAMQKK